MAYPVVRAVHLICAASAAVPRNTKTPRKSPNRPVMPEMISMPSTANRKGHPRPTDMTEVNSRNAAMILKRAMASKNW